VLMGHLHGTPADPSSIDPALPPAFDALLRKALARNPHQRHSSAGEFAHALRSAAGMELAPPPPAIRRTIDGRAVVPQLAVGDLAQPAVALAEQLTRKDTIRPPGSSERPRSTLVPPPELAAPRRAPRSGDTIWAILGLVLALAIGGGLLYAAGLLPIRSSNSGIGEIATARPTEPPAPTDAPTDAPPTPPQATDAPTSVPTSLATAVPPATSAPTSAPTKPPAPSKTPAPTKPPTPTATPAPTATTAPTEAPTATPKPTSTIDIKGGFKMLLDQDEGLRATLGDPLEEEQGGIETATEQQFDNGSMLFFKPTGQIYVLFGEGQGAWQVFEKQEVENLPEPPPSAKCSPPQQHGFALIWGNFPKIQKQLGCPLTPEPDLIESARQLFEGGTLLWSKPGLGRGPTIYALLKDGTFARYKDPNS
jgi:hypothetical protein